MTDVHLRECTDDDFRLFFTFMRDPVAARMAAFGTVDPDAEAFMARWRKNLASGSTTTQRTIVHEGVAVGFTACFLRDGKPEVTYWVARAHWGKGIATAALTELLKEVTVRPLRASAVKDNTGSLRVLARCGFVVEREESAFAEVRGEDVVEVFLVLR